MHAMKRVCFVCLGNICRSPLAEGVFRDLVRREGLADAFEVESAGIASYHVGDPPDPRSVRVAAQNGIVLDGVGQQFRAKDFDRFDLILALDRDIYASLERLAPHAAAKAKIQMLRAYDPKATASLDVPDPYYGNSSHFERVYEMVQRSCQGLLAAVTDGR
jgi:protein-tyrosine phosphatase